METYIPADTAEASEEDQFSIELTTPELAALSAVVALPKLPFDLPGLSEDPGELGEFISSGLRKLAERNYVQLPEAPGREMIVDEIVALMIYALSQPELGLLVTKTARGETLTSKWWLIRSGELLIDVDQSSPDTFVVTAHRTWRSAIDRVYTFVGLGEQSSPYDIPVRLKVEAMDELRYLVASSGEEEATRFLMDHDIAEKPAARLSFGLANSLKESMIQLWDLQDADSTGYRTLTVVEEPYGLWLIWPAADDETVIDVAPASGAQAANVLRGMVASLLPL